MRQCIICRLAYMQRGRHNEKDNEDEFVVFEKALSV
jgi:hypothetical protein